VADDAIDAARDQLVSGLDRDQPAEAVAEHKDRPEPQRSAGSEEEDAEPANGVAVEGPELLAVGVGREIAGQQLAAISGQGDPGSPSLRTGPPA
jgi:hypothetical protein